MKSLVLVMVLVGVAHAQPGAGQQPPPPYPQQYPPPPQQYQPGYAYPAQLTPEEHELLLDGEITPGQHIGGGVAALFLGFGSGQAIQGRWSDTGWIFTVGEAASIAAMIGGVVRTVDDCDNASDSCDENSDGPALIVVGLVGLTVFRVWEIVDAFSGPSDHNRRVRELKWRMGIPVQVGHKWSPYLNKNRDGGASAGLQLRF